LHDGSGPGLKSAAINGVRVRHIQAKVSWKRRKLSRRLAHHDPRIADLNLRVQDAAVLAHGWRVRHFGIESLLEKLDQLGHSRNDQIRRDAVITIGNWFDRHGYILLAIGFVDREILYG